MGDHIINQLYPFLSCMYVVLWCGISYIISNYIVSSVIRMADCSFHQIRHIDFHFMRFHSGGDHSDI